MSIILVASSFSFIRFDWHPSTKCSVCAPCLSDTHLPKPTMSFPQSDCLDDCLHVPYIRYTWCSALSLFDWSFHSFFSSLRHLCDFLLLRASRFSLARHAWWTLRKGSLFSLHLCFKSKNLLETKVWSALWFVYTSSSRCHIDSSIQQGNPVIITALHQKALAYIRSRIEDCHGDVELFVACREATCRARTHRQRAAPIDDRFTSGLCGHGV